MIFVELTENCNCRCEMCRPLYKNSPDKNMSFPLYKKIADTLFPYANCVDFRGWGESLINSNFQKYVEYAKQYPISQFKIITKDSFL